MSFLPALAVALLATSQTTQVKIPAGIGVGIHFIQAGPTELAKLKDLGVTYIRTDFPWGATEAVKGSYNFQNYDILVQQLQSVGIRPMFILDYGNWLYQDGAPTTDTAIAGFERWTKAAVTHFKGKGIVWEIWNEPNLDPYWYPKADATAYCNLAIRTAKAIRSADPTAPIIAPGISGFDVNFLETVFQSGLFDLIDGVSFHPYRYGAPESVAGDIKRLRGMISYFSPTRKLPIISSEWGYSTSWYGMTPAKQSTYNVRALATNMANGVAVSILYNWTDNGTDPNNPEHNFGLNTQSLVSKPTYGGVQYFNLVDRWFRFLGLVSNPGDPVTRMLFTTKSSDGRVKTRADYNEYQWKAGTDDMPYLQSMLPEVSLDRANTMSINAPLFETGNYAPDISTSISRWNGNPVAVLDNQSGTTGRLVLMPLDGSPIVSQTINRKSQTLVQGTLNLQPGMITKYQVDANNIPGVPFLGFTTVLYAKPDTTPITYKVVTQYSGQASQTYDVNATTTPEVGPASTFSYAFPEGYSFVTVQPKTAGQIPEGAIGAAIWVKTDGSNNNIRSRILDADNRTFQIDLGQLNDPGAAPGWRLIRISFLGDRTGLFWGGNQGTTSTGIPRGPLKWNSVLLIDAANPSIQRSGQLTFGPIMYQYRY